MEDDEIMKLIQTSPVLNEQEKKGAKAIWERYMLYGKASGVVLAGIKRLSIEAGLGTAAMTEVLKRLEEKNLFDWRKGDRYRRGVRTQPSQLHIHRSVWEGLGKSPSQAVSPVGQSTTQPNGSESPGEASTSHIWPSCTVGEDVTTVKVGVSEDSVNQEHLLKDYPYKEFVAIKDMKMWVDKVCVHVIKVSRKNHALNGEMVSGLKNWLLNVNKKYWKSKDMEHYIGGKETEIRKNEIEKCHTNSTPLPLRIE